ncbi:MAG: hypothetical protein U1E05_03905 [Patescibacteria group bacterium]|nr:hypothetical protein [Patescibacteria group bacterium]
MMRWGIVSLGFVLLLAFGGYYFLRDTEAVTLEAIRMGKLASEKGQPLEAIGHFSTAITFNPQLAEAYLLRAIAIEAHIEKTATEGSLRFSHTDTDAYYDLMEAIALAPTVGEAHVELGTLLIMQRWIGDDPYMECWDTKRADAVCAFTKAISLLEDPTFAYAGRAQSHWLRNDRCKTLADITKAIELSPLVWELYWDRATYAAFTGNYRLAIDDAAKARKLQTANAPVTQQDLKALELEDRVFEPIAIAQNSSEVQAVRQALMGTWKGDMHVNRIGITAPDPCQFIFDGHEAFFRVEEPHGTTVARVSLRFNPLADLHQVDAVVAPDSSGVLGVSSGTVLGIYDVDGDKFKLCFAFAGAPRPTLYTHTSPCPFQRLFVLQRVE